MVDAHVKIMDYIGKYLERNPELTFAQALYNLKINEFADKKYPERKGYLLRDIYSDSDEKILERITKR